MPCAYQVGTVGAYGATHFCQNAKAAWLPSFLPSCPAQRGSWNSVGSAEEGLSTSRETRHKIIDL